MATLAELAEHVGGTVVGDPGLEISRIAPIDSAGPGELTFVANPRYLPRLRDTRAAAVIVAPGVEAPSGLSLLVCGNPYLAFAMLLEHLQGRREPPQGVMPGADVHPTAVIGVDVTVHPGCVIGPGVRLGRGSVLHSGAVLYAGVEVGADCLIHAGVVIREGCRLGDRVVVQPNAVIGSDGFGFAPDGQRYRKIPQVGIVEIGDDVEIGACTCIDRAALGVTRIGRGAKLDNLVQIGHNAEIGEDTLLVAQVGIAGSTRIGNHCTFGGQAGVAGHLRIGDDVMIGAQGGVAANLDSGQILSGSPAIPHKDWLRASMSFARLPEMRKEIGRLRRQLEELEQLVKETSRE